MGVERGMKTITTRIKREWLAEIVAGKKTVEYREIKPYWDRMLDGVAPPFELRLINGMQKHAPEVTVVVDRVRRSLKDQQYHLHILKVVRWANWDKRRGLPRSDHRE